MNVKPFLDGSSSLNPFGLALMLRLACQMFLTCSFNASPRRCEFWCCLNFFFRRLVYSGFCNSINRYEELLLGDVLLHSSSLYVSAVLDFTGKSFFSVDNPAVILETVKKVRIYW